MSWFVLVLQEKLQERGGGYSSRVALQSHLRVPPALDVQYIKQYMEIL